MLILFASFEHLSANGFYQAFRAIVSVLISG